MPAAFNEIRTLSTMRELVKISGIDGCLGADVKSLGSLYMGALLLLALVCFLIKILAYIYSIMCTLLCHPSLNNDTFSSLHESLYCIFW